MPRKTPCLARQVDLMTNASMRPRPDAAENVRFPHGGGGETLASMRPRPDAAENARRRTAAAAAVRRFNEAAARCRGKRAARWPRRSPRPRFNEAAARCRGKRALALAADQGADASMRPRPDAAENTSPTALNPTGSMCFNEAAARCRGKREHSRLAILRIIGFNEAAARCRGKPGLSRAGASLFPLLQ